MALSNAELILPTRPNGSWKYPWKKKPKWNTYTITPASRRGQVRIPLQHFPIWEFDLNISYLKGTEQLSSAYEYLIGFYNDVQGSAQSFLFTDPNDNTVTQTGTPGSSSGLLAPGDGVSTQFQLVRQWGGFVDIVQNPSIVNVYVNGTLQTLGVNYTYTTQGGVITFTNPPTVGYTITWAGTFYYRIHFLEDTIDDLQQIYYQIWAIDSLKFESVLF
jgi:uncharacterized protein (TIGR02217 family)